jgi:hypothetical protein
MAVVIVLRKPIGVVLGQGVRRLKAGPVEVEFDQLEREVREELARSPELAEAQVPAPAASLREELATLARVSPPAAVLEAYKRIEARLAEMLASAGRETPYTVSGRAVSGRTLARMARQDDLISDETLAAVEGLAVLRNLTANAGGDIGVERAHDYLALADAVLYALRPKLSSYVLLPEAQRGRA